MIWSYNCNNAAKKKVTYLGTSIVRVCQSIFNIFPQRITKPVIRKSKNHRKSSSSAERSAQNFRACEKSQYDVWNCISGRHNQHHTFKYCRLRYKPISTNIPYDGLMVKGKKRGISKAPSLCRQNWMLCSINHCQDITVREYTKLKSPLLPFD